MTKKEKILEKQDFIEVLRAQPYPRGALDYVTFLASCLTGKEPLPPGGITSLSSRRSSLFVSRRDLLDVVSQMTDFMAEGAVQGFPGRAAVESALVAAARPDLPSAALDLACDEEALNTQPDRLTGFQQTSQTEITTNLCTLYARTVGRQASAFEIDFTNVGGTNEFFLSHLRKLYPDRDDRELLPQAMDMTDRAVRIVSHVIRHTLEDFVKGENAARRAAGTLATEGEVRLQFLRTGGDEARVIATDLSPENARALLPLIHDRIEHITGLMGLHHHPHRKYKDNPALNGFGASMTVFDLLDKTNFQEKIRRAGEQIAETKLEHGMMRRRAAALSSDTSPRTLASIREAMDILEQDDHLQISTHDGSGRMLALIPPLELVAASQTPQNLLSISDIQSIRTFTFQEKLAAKNIAVNDPDLCALQIKLGDFPARDAPTGFLADRDFPVLAATALQIHHDIRQDQLNRLPAGPVRDQVEKTAEPLTLGVSFSNLGGLNKVLGTTGANGVLNVMAQDIIVRSLEKAGIAKEYYYAAHMRGGGFHIVVQSIIPGPGGSVRVLGREEMEIISREIQERTKKLNALSIAEFVRNKRLDPANLASLPNHFRDLPHSEQSQRPWNNGIHAAVAVQIYDPGAYQGYYHADRAGTALSTFIGYKLNEVADTDLQHRKPLPRQAFAPALQV